MKRNFLAVLNACGNRSACFQSPLGSGGVRFHQTGESHGYHQESRVAKPTYLVLRRCERRERKHYDVGILRSASGSADTQRHHEGRFENRSGCKSAYAGRQAGLFRNLYAAFDGEPRQVRAAPSFSMRTRWPRSSPAPKVCSMSRGMVIRATMNLARCVCRRDFLQGCCTSFRFRSCRTRSTL